MRIGISDKAKNLLPKILEQIQAEGLANWEVRWLANHIIDAEERSHELAAFVIHEERLNICRWD